MNWYSISHHEGTAHVHIGDDIGSFEIGFDSFAKDLGSPAHVDLTVNSNGGDSQLALQINELLRKFDATTTIVGQCCSAAVTVALSGRLIKIQQSARMMVHSPVSSIIGNPAQLRSEAEKLERLIPTIATLYAERTNQPIETVREWLAGDDKWFTADEALAVGLVDEIIEPPPKSRVAIRTRIEEKVKDIEAEKQPRTDEQKLFSTFLCSFFNRLRVRDKAEFGQELADWFQSSVREG